MNDSAIASAAKAMQDLAIFFPVLIVSSGIVERLIVRGGDPVLPSPTPIATVLRDSFVQQTEVAGHACPIQPSKIVLTDINRGTVFKNHQASACKLQNVISCTSCNTLCAAIMSRRASWTSRLGIWAR